MEPLDLSEEVSGIAFETLFPQELVAINDTLRLGYLVYYWKTSNQMEIDFVLYGERGLKVFEVKRTDIVETVTNGKTILSFSP